MNEITEPDDEILNQDPRSSLAQWANKNDEWIRRIVRQVLVSGGELPESERAVIYQLFLQEKGFDKRTLQVEPLIVSPAQPLGQPDALYLTRISNVRGVNALVEGEHIDFAHGLTILFGENAAGKTGYTRILKWMAGSRSAEDILPDVNLKDKPPNISVEMDYRLGETEHSIKWNGERAQQPFTQMSVFDNPSANLHVDSDLRYTYRPASLAFFDLANHEVQNIAERIEKERQTLNSDNSSLLSRFDSSSSIYPFIESLGSATDLQKLKKFLCLPDNTAEQVEELESIIAALRADVVGQQVSFKSGFQNVLTGALNYTSAVGNFRLQDYNAALTRLFELHSDQTTLRESLFAAANLPAEPEQTWEEFIRSGQGYRRHLEGLGVHDDARCLYCRQLLGTDALELIAKYREYLESHIARDIEAQESTIQVLIEPVEDTSLAAVQAFCEPTEAEADKGIPAPTDQLETLRNLVRLDGDLKKQLKERGMVDKNILSTISEIGAKIDLWLSEVKETLEVLRAQDSDREKTQAKKENELLELKDRVELNKSWVEVEKIAAVARREDRLKSEREAISSVLRNITILSNKASDQLINENFEELFRNECLELRTPRVRVRVHWQSRPN